MQNSTNFMLQPFYFDLKISYIGFKSQSEDNLVILKMCTTFLDFLETQMWQCQNPLKN